MMAEDLVDHFITNAIANVGEFAGTLTPEQKKAVLKTYDFRSGKRKENIELIKDLVSGTLVENIGDATTADFMASDERSNLTTAVGGVAGSIVPMAVMIAGDAVNGYDYCCYFYRGNTDDS